MNSAWLRFLRVLLFCSLVLAVVPYGAVHPGWLATSNIVSALLFVLALTEPLPMGHIRRVFFLAVVVALALALWTLLQSMQFAANPLAHPIWKTASDLVGASGGAISVDPATSRAALPNLVTPFLAFLTILLLYQDDESLLRLWWGLTFFGVAVAVFAIIQTVFFPGSLLWGPRSSPMAALTATFVNRNTAVTFLGLAALLPLGLGARFIDQLRHDGGFATLRGGRMSRSLRMLLLVFMILMTDLTAMFMTQSRGGIFATFLGISVAAVALAATAMTGRNWNLRRLVVPVLIIAVIIIGFATYAARAIHRADMLGFDEGRLCTYRATLEAIADFPLFGTGFGTFDQVFPHYRILDCAGIDGIWYKAHNVYLEGYLGLGLPFAVVLVVGVAVLILMSIRGMSTRRRYRFAGAVLLGGLVLLLMHSAADFSLQIHGVAIWTAAIFGVAGALSLGRSRTTSLP